MKLAIFATDKHWNFGNNDGSLPWGSPIKEDMKYFMSVTKNIGTVVMGAKTFMSLPRKLKDRCNVVVARPGSVLGSIRAKNNEIPDLMITATTTTSFELIDKKLASKDIKEYALIGGAGLISKAVESGFLDQIHMTLVEGEYPADIKLKPPEKELKATQILTSTTNDGIILLFYLFKNLEDINDT